MFGGYQMLYSALVNFSHNSVMLLILALRLCAFHRWLGFMLLTEEKLRSPILFQACMSWLRWILLAQPSFQGTSALWPCTVDERRVWNAPIWVCRNTMKDGWIKDCRFQPWWLFPSVVFYLIIRNDACRSFSSHASRMLKKELMPASSFSLHSSSLQHCIVAVRVHSCCQRVLSFCFLFRCSINIVRLTFSGRVWQL